MTTLTALLLPWKYGISRRSRLGTVGYTVGPCCSQITLNKLYSAKATKTHTEICLCSAALLVLQASFRVLPCVTVTNYRARCVYCCCCNVCVGRDRGSMASTSAPSDNRQAARPLTATNGKMKSENNASDAEEGEAWTWLNNLHYNLEYNSFSVVYKR